MCPWVSCMAEPVHPPSREGDHSINVLPAEKEGVQEVWQNNAKYGVN